MASFTSCLQGVNGLDANSTQAEVDGVVCSINGAIEALVLRANFTALNEAIATAKANEKITAEIADKSIVKELYVKGRLVNIVVK